LKTRREKENKKYKNGAEKKKQISLAKPFSGKQIKKKEAT